MCVRRYEVVIVGAGLAGLTAGQDLSRAGHDVLILEKARGPGGRTCTRRGQSNIRLDHGCQFISSASKQPISDVSDWMNSDLIVPWHAKQAPGSPTPDFAGDHWAVGTPTMSVVAKKLAQGLDVLTQWHVDSIDRTGKCWCLKEKDGVRSYESDLVILATPAPQVLSLLGEHAFSQRDQLHHASYHPVWSLLIEGPDIPEVPFEFYGSQTEPLQWLVAQHARPHRDSGRAWVGLASYAWSLEHLEEDHRVVADALLASANRLAGVNLSATAQVHRWRYGVVSDPVGIPVLADTDQRIVACGDWCLGKTVEHAVQSGHAASQAAIQILASDHSS